jgi:hypothetical protein
MEESFEEDNMSCEQLVKSCDKEYLLNICVKRREIFDIVLQNYQNKPTDLLAQELAKTYEAVDSLCASIREKYCEPH